MKRSKGSSPRFGPPGGCLDRGGEAPRPVSARLIAAVLASGFSLRAAFLFQLRNTPYYFNFLLSDHDQKTWAGLGALVMRHPWFVDGRPFYQAPGYAYFLGLLFRVFGPENYLAVGLVQACLDTLGGYLVFLLGRRLWNRGVGLAACLAYLLYRPFIVYSVILLSDSFILFTNILCLFLLYRAIDRPGDRKRWFCTGLAFGVAAVAKPTILLFAVLAAAAFPAAAFLAAGGRGGGILPAVPAKRALAACLAAALAGFLLPVLPVVIRNSLYAGHFVTLATYGPINWQIGNSADSFGLFMYPQGPLLSPLSADFWRLWGKKTVLFFSSYEWPQNINIYLLAELNSVIRLPLVNYGLVAPLGLAGLLAFKRRDLFLGLYIFASVVSVIAFFITGRYRLPAAAGFILSACGCLDFLWRRAVSGIRSRTGSSAGFSPLRPALVLAAWLAISFSLVNTWEGPLIGDAYAGNYGQLTERAVNHFVSRGEYDRAELFRGRWNAFARRYISGEIR